ncbi:unnamed protein product [Darwinula stevensoni]|uniref:Uncharacterized protein n=1 Tax=Darwinula stevensoni TaxID=69355 RepID=A0A7R9A1R7_9CRUS|nr:unnamed protein product [Darwinula stevensoni]CAG0884153.1 unnamed protein product [Darwinula stevensoni]
MGSEKQRLVIERIVEGEPTMKRSVLLILLSLAMSWAQLQNATIYDLPNFDEGGAWSSRIGYCPDFRDCDPFIGDNTVSSTCVVGIWLFYSEYFYNYENFGGVEWVHGTNYCTNLGALSNQVSSLKYVGHPYNWKIDTITLYEFDLFFGLEYHEWVDATEVPEQLSGVGSVIITGENNWTVYSLPNYDGDRVCLGVDQGQYVGFAPDLTAFGVGTVGSFRRGCFSDRNLQDIERNGERNMKRSVLLLALSLAMSWAQQQVALIYDWLEGDEGGAWSERNSYCQDFRSCDRYIGDNVISSTCITGVWIFYGESNYNSQSSGVVEYNAGDYYCWNLGIANNQVSSLRYAGDTFAWKDPSLNLYQFEYFCGMEFFETQDTPQLPVEMDTVDSFIITGREYWTLYSVFNIPTVKSFRRGCFAERKILLRSDQRGVEISARN